MRLSKHKHGDVTRMNITPMIDIVFLLLIFFITVSQISEAKLEPVDLPKQRGGGEQKQATLTVNVNQEDEIIVSGKVTSATQLVLMVNDELARLGNDPSRLTIVLRSDRRATNRPTGTIVKALKEMGVNKIRLAVESPDG